MLIAGVDEAGRGPLAGPVVAAAAVFKKGYRNPRIKDSKKLTKASREELYELIRERAVAWSIVAVGHRRIQQMNILRASLLAMSLAVKRVSADLVIVDGNHMIPTAVPQKAVVKADAKHVQVAAASILAKVWRDRLMERIDAKYPGYEFAAHSGYATAEHREALAKLGPCRIHRRTFEGVREFFSPYQQLDLLCIDSSDPNLSTATQPVPPSADYGA